jgi:ribosome-associated toxin RatA of RatAB toxin-antitoxin module
MYAIVDDVEAYPRRFEWCESAEVLKSTAAEKIAKLGLRFAGMSTSFTTRNLLKPNERIELALVEGPFSALRGVWSFKALSAKGCKIALDLDFDLAGGLVGSALALGFQAVADHMVDDFVRAGLAR